MVERLATDTIEGNSIPTEISGLVLKCLIQPLHSSKVTIITKLTYVVYCCLFQNIEYTIPNGQDITAFRNAIEKLPLNDTPELFGLHPNADITYRTKQSQQVLSTILGMSLFIFYY